MRTRLIVCALCLFWSVAAVAQPLAEKIPGDALVYAGWAGSADMPKGYEGSHLQAVVEASDIGALLNQTLPALIQRIGRDNPRDAEKLRLVMDLVKPMLRHTSALYIGKVDFSNPNLPVPQMALLCQAGAEAEGLVQRIQPLLAEVHDLPFALRAVNQDGLVVVILGTTPALDQLVGLQAGGQKPASLDQEPRFKEALGKAGDPSAGVLYIDAENMLSTINEAMDRFGSPRDKKRWDQVRDGLGLGGLKQALWTSGFDGKDWTSRGYFNAPEPRSGILSLLAGRPVGEETLQRVPRTATLFSVSRMDLASAWKEMMRVSEVFDASSRNELGQLMDRMNQTLGIDVVNDLLPALGDQWVYYWDPSLGGSGMLSGAVLARPSDPAKVEQLLTRARQNLQKYFDKQMGRSGMSVHFRETQSRGVTIHYLAIPAVAPAWAVHDGTLYVGLYPQTVSSAVALAKQGGSILDNEGFLAWRKRLGGDSATRVSYADLKPLAPQGYPTILMISRIALGMSDLFGVEAPAMVPPPMDVLMAHIGGSGHVGWADAQGIYFQQVTPFPGADLLTTDLTSGLPGSQLLGAAILVPSLGRSREAAQRVKCASNMRQIGQAILLFSNEHRGQYPPDLGTLLKTQDLGGEVFFCPSSNDERPPNWGQMNLDQQAEWINRHSSYIYIGKGRNNRLPGDDVVLYEKPDNHAGDGTNLLFGDGHVEFMPLFSAGRAIEKTTGQNPFLDGDQ